MSAQTKLGSADDDKDLSSTFDELYAGASAHDMIVALELRPCRALAPSLATDPPAGKDKGAPWAGSSSFGSYSEQPSWHDEILAICRDTGLESLAAETGLIQSGEVAGVKHYSGQRGQLSALPDPVPPPAAASAEAQSRSAASVSVSAAELAQALLSPSTPSAANSSAAWSTDMTPSYAPSSIVLRFLLRHPDASLTTARPRSSRRRKRKPESANGTPSSPGGTGRGKGLRHFSSRVCEKVEQKKVTSYNEVADELVRELQDVPLSEKGPLDQVRSRDTFCVECDTRTSDLHRHRRCALTARTHNRAWFPQSAFHHTWKSQINFFFFFFFFAYSHARL